MNNERRVFDVMRPGSVPAGPTSRPIITTHRRPAIPDDQFVPEHGNNQNHNLTKTRRITITPDEKPDEDPLKSLQVWADNADDDTPDHKVGTAEKPETTFQPEAFSTEENSGTEDELPPAALDTTDESEPTAPPLDLSVADTDITDAAESPEDTLDDTKPDDTTKLANETTEGSFEAPTQSVAETQEEQPAQENDPAVAAPSFDTPEPTVTTPITGNTSTPAEPPEQLLVSHHKKPTGKLFWVAMVFFALLISLVVVNFLLDANFLPGDNIPHTDLIKESL